MKTITVNPDVAQQLQALIASNPVECFIGMTIVLLSVTYRFRNAF